MARVLSLVVLCVCVAIAFAADLRRLNQERAAALAPPQATGVGGKNTGDLDTANSWGWGGWGGPGFYGGPWGWGPWGYGYGLGYGYPYGGIGWW